MTDTPSYHANHSHHLPLYRFDLAKLSICLSVRNGAITPHSAKVYKNPDQVTSEQLDEAIEVLTHLRSQILPAPIGS
jgi:hypothetical protein